MNVLPSIRCLRRLVLSFTLSGLVSLLPAEDRPHIVLVMSDDQGWGQAGYMGHPLVKTPHLDAMAKAGLRFDRFYAGASNCSPTRASLLTGRTNDRTGVETHGFPLRRQEKTIAQALRDVGYSTGHFGKWHLNGLRGEGAPIFAEDPLNPGVFGFETWVSVTNFFDLNPLMSRNGAFEDFEGDSSEIIVDEALGFMREHHSAGPLLVVIWYGTPHRPFYASEEDVAGWEHLPESERLQLGELRAMDRSIGTLRAGLREMGIAENTLLWFNSDNGGLADWGPKTVGHLRGFKNSPYEGGLRVPAVVEWPRVVAPGGVTHTPVVTMDIFPTIADILALPTDAAVLPQDGQSILPLLRGEDDSRRRAIPFRRENGAALIDGDWKIVNADFPDGAWELYDLAQDPREQNDLSGTHGEELERMLALWQTFDASRQASIAGADYPEGELLPNPPERAERAWWMEKPEYLPYLEAWSKRPEYQKRLTPLVEKKD